MDAEFSAIGIDFGTTNSLVALAKNQQPFTLIDHHTGLDLIRSKVTIDQFGLILAYHSNHVNYNSVKRLLGKNFNDIIDDKLFTAQIANKILLNDNNQIKIQFSKSFIYSPVEITAFILKKLSDIANKYTNSVIANTVITIPAYYDDRARQDTMKAAKMAGLNVLRLISEPTAAAYAYGIDKKKNGKYIVYDFGGGTFDISILSMQDHIFQVLATNGDRQLGGDDIDNLLQRLIVDKIKNTINYHLSNKELDLIIAQIQDDIINIKKILSIESEANINLAFATKQYLINITQAEFETIVNSLIYKTITMVEDTIEEANLTNSEIAGLILVGGSSRLKIIEKLLKNNFSFPILSDLNPDKVVAFGAALQAENLSKRAKNLIIDVTPLSLGLELLGGLNEKIILRNTPIPCKVTRYYTTHANLQNAMKFHIVQGERELTAECISLGEFELDGIPPLPAGMAKIAVIFELDANGVLTVLASEQTTNTNCSIILSTLTNIDDNKVQNILNDAAENIHNDKAARLWQETLSKAKQLMTTIDDVLNEYSQLKDLDKIQDIINQQKHVEKMIDTGESLLLNDAIQNLEKVSTSFIVKFNDQKIAKILQNNSIIRN